MLPPRRDNYVRAGERIDTKVGFTHGHAHDVIEARGLYHN